jgi:hypothetical protein
MPHRHRFTLLIATASIVATGCGSQGVSRASLVAQADPICKQVAAKRAAANATVPSSLTTIAQELPALARVAPGVAADERQAVARLRTLKAPASLARDWQTLLAGIEQLANDTAQLGADAKAGDFNTAHALVRRARHLREALTVVAERDGFAYCGRTS